jgi:hypothetical protein
MISVKKGCFAWFSRLRFELINSGDPAIRQRFDEGGASTNPIWQRSDAR